MELWDVYDADRRPTGRTAERGAAHSSAECQLVVHVCLFNPRGELLIQQRHRAKRAYPEYWDVSAAGGVISGETPREAAAREVREELGLTVEITPPAAVTLAFAGGFDDYFLVDCDVPLDALTLQPDEVQDARWATQAEIRALLEADRFAPYWPSFLDLLFDLHRHMGLRE